MSEPGAFGIDEVMRRLPHRYPMLLVDRVLECVAGERVVALKNVTANEQFFAGHFPGRPVMPGVMVLEALAQTAGILAFVTANVYPDENVRFYFAGIDKARFQKLDELLQGHPEEAVILFAVELCSLTIQRDDLSMANLVASGLFGDGAAAVLMVGESHPLAQPGLPRVIDSQSQFFPETEHIMGWEVTDSGFKVMLSADIAALARSQVRPGMEAFLGRHGLAVADIGHWLVHPGGPKVIQALEAGLGLPGDALALSWETLSEAGNISSASVLLILDKLMERRQPSPDGHAVLMAPAGRVTRGPSTARDFDQAAGGRFGALPVGVPAPYVGGPLSRSAGGGSFSTRSKHRVRRSSSFTARRAPA